MLFTELDVLVVSPSSEAPSKEASSPAVPVLTEVI
jgi:hypothetical protein